MKRYTTIYVVAMFVLVIPCIVLAGQVQITVTDMTPTTPLQNPLPSLYEPRYISGFGSGDSFTLFFEDRSFPFPYPIDFVTTTAGPTGFSNSAISTNVKDTHFCVKDWPITIDGTNYAYRAWGALENTPKHRFYVSDDLEVWEQVSEFTIPTLSGVAGGTVYYCFHDVIYLNGTYYAWGECNIGHTLICRSANGDDKWEAFDRIGGLFAGPLQLPAVGTPTGSFFELGGDRGYGKLMVPGNDSAIYLAVNTAAKPSLPPGELEAAFINPDNWTWHDGSVGLPGTPILEETDYHDLEECWLVSNGGSEWTIIYDADFGAAYGKALGYAILSIPIPNRPPLADAGPDQTVEQESHAGTEVLLDGSASTDPDSTQGTNDDIVSFDWYEGNNFLGSGETIRVTFQLGVHSVTLRVTDSHGETDEDAVTIVVEDATPPTIDSITAMPDVLWPPNHKMLDVDVLVEASDICTEPGDLILLSATAESSEPDDDKGDGSFAGDVNGADGFTTAVDITDYFEQQGGCFWGVIYLSAECDKRSASRIYTITVTIADLSGNWTEGSCDVVVPHNRGKDTKK
jgi:hypothetical protein